MVVNRKKINRFLRCALRSSLYAFLRDIGGKIAGIPHCRALGTTLIMSSNNQKNQIFGLLISTLPILECKNTICCGTVQLRCHKMVIFFCALNWEFFPRNWEKPYFLPLGTCQTQISVTKMGQKTPAYVSKMRYFFHY